LKKARETREKNILVINYVDTSRLLKVFWHPSLNSTVHDSSIYFINHSGNLIYKYTTNISILIYSYIYSLYHEGSFFRVILVKYLQLLIMFFAHVWRCARYLCLVVQRQKPLKIDLCCIVVFDKRQHNTRYTITLEI